MSRPYLDSVLPELAESVLGPKNKHKEKNY